jgi:hypothetical protein
MWAAVNRENEWTVGPKKVDIVHLAGARNRSKKEEEEK